MTTEEFYSRRQSAQECFRAFLDLISVFSGHWTQPMRELGVLFSGGEKPDYLFESLPRHLNPKSDDPLEIWSLVPVAAEYRVIEDSDLFVSYRVRREDVPVLMAEVLVEFYLLPVAGDDWVFVCTDGYEHFPSMLVGRST